MGEFVVVRHADTAWTATGQHTGRTDLALTAAGREAATRVAERLAGREFARVLTSPLVRATETCELAGYVGTPCSEAVEWDYGDYEGLTTPEIRAERPGWDLWRDGCPGGEDAAAVGGRADTVVSLAVPDGDTLCFSHGHFTRVLVARWLGLPPTAGALWAIAPGAIGILGFERERRVLRGWGL
jgi:broad specificity phosphatase PhoE